MTPTLSFTRYTILDQLLLSGDQSVHGNEMKIGKTKILEGPFNRGTLRIRSPLRQITRTAKSSGGASSREPGSVGHPGPTSRDRAQDPRWA